MYKRQTPIPTVEELNAHVWGEEFHACVIEKAEFEYIWETHTYDGALKLSLIHIEMCIRDRSC